MNQAKPKKLKRKKCKVCKEYFEPFRPLQVCCGPDCAKVKVESDRIRKEEREIKVERKKAKERLKSRSDWMREAQVAFNKYIRLRDAELPCISCDRPPSWNGQWHASHYYATSIRPNLRFDEDNVHKACSICNNYMHGNLTPYRERLLSRIGTDRVAVLDDSREPRKYTVEELKEIKEKYSKIGKSLK